MRLFFSSVIILLSGTCISNAESVSDPIQALEKLMSATCVAVPVAGSAVDFSIEGDADVRLSSVLEWLGDGGLSGAANYNVQKYEGFLQSEVGARSDIEQKCRLQIYQDFSPLVVDWLKEAKGEGSKTATVKGDKNIVIQGDGSMVTNGTPSN